MEQNKLDSFIGEPLENVKSTLEKEGISVQIINFSKPMINKGELLVVKAENAKANKVNLYVAEFKIDI